MLMSPAEWFAFISGVLCVYLIVIEKDINWPIGLINSVALIYVFWTHALYAQVGLQAFYVLECLYGWWLWTRKDSSGFKILRIGKTKTELSIKLAIISVAGTVLLYPILQRTGDPYPFWDSAIAVCSIVAEYMLCLKLLEAWGLYLACDIASLVILAKLGDWVTFGTYGCFTILCIMGIIAWKKTLTKSDTDLLLASSTL